MNATKNRKQTLSLTTTSTEDGMYNKGVSKVSQKVYEMFCISV